MEKTAHSGNPEGAYLSWKGLTDPTLPFVGGWIGLSMESQNAHSVENCGPTDLDRFTDPICPGMIRLHRGLNNTDLSFVCVVFFIRAHLRGASFGTKLSEVQHGPILLLETARVR